MTKNSIAQLISAKIIFKNKESNNIGNIFFYWDKMVSNNVSDDVLFLMNYLVKGLRENEVFSNFLKYFLQILPDEGEKSS